MSPSAYIPALTWLRGLAAFLVVVSHALRTVEGPWTVRTHGIGAYFTGQPLWFPRLFDLGSFGVCLFFALSGFTLYVSNRKGLQDWSGLPAFYVKRVFRIWPAFMLSLAIYTAFALWLWPSYEADDWVWMQGNFVLPDSLAATLAYVLLTFDLTGPAGLFVGPYWSLPVELHYYLLLAPTVVLMAHLRRGRFLVPVAVGGVLVVLGRNQLVPLADLTVFNMALSFFLGVALADLHERGRLPMLPRPGWAWGLALTVILVASGVWQGFLSNRLEDLVYILGPVLMVYAFLHLRAPAKPGPLTRLLAKYGTYSYSVYLFHMLVYGMIALVANRLDIELNEGLFWPVFLLGAVGSYALAALAYRWVEVPSMDWGRRCAALLGRRGVATPAVSPEEKA